MPFISTHYTIREPIAAFLFLMRECGYTQKQAQKALDKRRLTQDSRPIHKGEIISGIVELSHFEPCDIGLEPLFYNNDFCVYDKPHNLLTHPKGIFPHTSLLDALRARFGSGANAIHRLDSQTSGLVLCATNPNTESALKSLIQERRVEKSYRAIVRGKLMGERRVDEPILTHHIAGEDLSIRSVVSPQGRKSSTILRPLRYLKERDCTLIEALPLTGRTHQIRLHCAHINHPILGDPLYGADDTHSRTYLSARGLLSAEEYAAYFGAPHLCLNAYSLRFCFRDESFYFQSQRKLEVAKQIK